MLAEGFSGTRTMLAEGSSSAEQGLTGGTPNAPVVVADGTTSADPPFMGMFAMTGRSPAITQSVTMPKQAAKRHSTSPKRRWIRPSIAFDGGLLARPASQSSLP